MRITPGHGDEEGLRSGHLRTLIDQGAVAGRIVTRHATARHRRASAVYDAAALLAPPNSAGNSRGASRFR